MRKILSILVVVSTFISVKAQDVHYSQFYALPVTLNPALTGFFDSEYRLAGIYRSQWAGFAPFLTQSVSAEFKKELSPDDPNNNKRIGFGMLLTNDKAGIDAGISTMKGYGSVAAHMDLGPFFINGGLQAGYIQRSLFGVNRFPDQWDELQDVFDESIPTSEVFDNNVGYLDVNAGLLLTALFGDEVTKSAYLGVASFHVYEPSEKFVAATVQNVTPRRWVAHMGGRIQFQAGSPFSVVPNAIFMRIPKANANEINAGIDVEYDFNATNNDFTGVWTVGGYRRFGDSYIIHTAMEVNDFLIGFSYDINSSSLQAASSMNGGFELSVRFTPKPAKKFNRYKSNPCPTI